MLEALEEKIRYKFRDRSLLRRAVVHKSYFFENQDKIKGHNETLEFLGDAVLDLSVAELGMAAYPEASEGELTKRRASIVNEQVLAKIAESMDLKKFILLGKSEVSALKSSIAAGCIEGIIGAVFIDGGYFRARELVAFLFEPYLNAVAQPWIDHKTALQEYAQAQWKSAPTYEVLSEGGPSHSPQFQVEVRIQGVVYGQGDGKSKREAAQNAAEMALKSLGVR
jgi:ribonuclease III